MNLRRELGWRSEYSIYTGRPSSSVLVASYEFPFCSPSASESGKVVAELQKEIECLLKQNDCEIRGHGQNVSLRAAPAIRPRGFHEFSLEYSQGRTEGDVYVYAMEGRPVYARAGFGIQEGPEYPWVLVVLIHEWLK